MNPFIEGNHLTTMFQNEIGETNRTLAKHGEYLWLNNNIEAGRVERFSTIEELNNFWENIRLPDNMRIDTIIEDGPDMTHQSL